MIRTLLISALLLVSSGAFAQTSTSDASSQSQSGSQSVAANEGVALTNTFTSPDHTRATIRSAPGTVMGAFGTSFSADGCMNTTQAGVSFLGGSIAGGGPVTDQNCAHIRRGYAFGQAAAYANQSGNPAMAAKLLAMVNWEFCTADPQTLDACNQLGLVKVKQGQ